MKKLDTYTKEQREKYQELRQKWGLSHQTALRLAKKLVGKTIKGTVQLWQDWDGREKKYETDYELVYAYCKGCTKKWISRRNIYLEII